MGILWLPNILQCRNRCLAGIVAVAFIHIKGFNVLLCESDPENEGSMALVVPRLGKSFVPPSLSLLNIKLCCSGCTAVPLLEGFDSCAELQDCQVNVAWAKCPLSIRLRLSNLVLLL